MTEPDTVTMPPRAVVIDQPGEIRLAFEADDGTREVEMTPMAALAIADALVLAATRRLGAARCPRCGELIPPPEREPVPAGKAFGSTETSPSGRFMARKTLR